MRTTTQPRRMSPPPVPRTTKTTLLRDGPDLELRQPARDPVALLGLISYLLIFVSLRLAGEQLLLGGYALTLIAFAFTIYLTYREIFPIRAICSWCVSSAIVFTA